jgi:hypothetical protein
VSIPKSAPTAATIGPSTFRILESHLERMWGRRTQEANSEKEFRDIMIARLVSAWDDIPDTAILASSDIDWTNS